MSSDLGPDRSPAAVKNRGLPVLCPLELQGHRPVPKLQKTSGWASWSPGRSTTGLASDGVMALCHFTEQTLSCFLRGNPLLLVGPVSFFPGAHSTDTAQKKECSHWG